MDLPPICFGMPINLEVVVIDIIDVPNDQAYRKVLTKVWVDKGLDNLVPHEYIA